MGGGIVYASASKGFNSGGFAGGAATDPRQLTPYRSERLYAYEAGFKRDLLGRTLRLGASAFYYDYRDLQEFVFDVSGALPVQRKLNAGNARVYGADLSAVIRPRRHFDVSLAGGYLDTRYTRFTALAGTDYSGNQLISAPRWSFSGAVNATQPLGSRAELRERLDGSFQSSTFLTPDNAPAYRVPAFGLLNARLGVGLDGGRYEIAAFGRNLTSTRYVAYRSPSITLDLLDYNEPTTYGVQLTARLR